MAGSNNTNPFSTAGIKLKYAIEATSGTRPGSGYTELTSVVSLPSLNAEPSTLDVTDLSELEYKQSIPGLKDAGNFALKCNLTQAVIEAWNTLVSSTTEASGGRKRAWFEIVMPAASGYTKSFFFSGYPVKAGFPGADVDQPFQGEVSITVSKVDGWQTASTES